MAGLQENNQVMESAAEVIKTDQRLRWKVEAWLKGRERRRFHENPPKVLGSFESYWKTIRYETLEKGLLEALLAIAEIEKRKRVLPDSPSPAENFLTAAGPPSNRRVEDRRSERNTLITLIMSGVGGAPVRETGTVENLSRRGACILLNQNVECGRYLQVITPVRKKSLMATVRASRPGPDSKVYLHLQFVNQEWPVERDFP